jgi:transposase-like protein
MPFADGSIDAGIHLLYLATPRGVTRTTQEIADVAGCNKNNIWLIEKRALKKLEIALAKRGLKIFLNKQRETEMNEKNIDYTKLEQMVTEGKSVDEICLEFGISSGSYYNWQNSDQKWKDAIVQGKQRRKGVPATASNGQVELPEDEEEALRIIEEKVVEAIGGGSNLRRAIHTALEMYPPGKIGQAISGLVAARAIVERQCGAVTAYFVKGSEPPATSKLVMNGNGGVDIVTIPERAAAAPVGSPLADFDQKFTKTISENGGRLPVVDEVKINEEDPLDIPDQEEDVVGKEYDLSAAADHAEFPNGPDGAEDKIWYCGNCGAGLFGEGNHACAGGAKDEVQVACDAEQLVEPEQQAPASPFDLLAEKELPVDNFSQQREKETEKAPETGPRDEQAKEAEPSRWRDDPPKRPKTLFEHLFENEGLPGIGGMGGSRAFFPMAGLMAAMPMPQFTTAIDLKSGRLVIDFSGSFFKENALGRDLLCAIAEVVEAHEEQARAERTPRVAEEVVR